MAASASVEAPIAMIKYRRLAANKISRQFRQSLVLALRGAVFDGQVSPLDKAGFLQTLPNRSDRHGV